MANQGSAKQDRPLTRWEGEGSGPFSWMRQMQDQVDRAFTGLWRGGESTSLSHDAVFGRPDWSPALDVFQRGNELVIRADVPGLSKDDITVDIADDKLAIHGERRYDHEEERNGVFRSERSHGSFYRAVPLPPGAIADSAKATFNNGVLEIVLEAPSAEVRRGRRVEIRERTPEKADQLKP